MTVDLSTYSVYLKFGKYKGKSFGFVADTDPQYLQWMVRAPGMSDDIKEKCRRTLSGESLEENGVPAIFVPLIATIVNKKKKNKVQVHFSYNENMISRFKMMVDSKTFNKVDKRWEVAIPQIPKVVECFGIENVRFDILSKQWYDEELTRKKELDVIRDLTDCEIDIPALTRPLFPYQKVGIKFVERASGRALIADEPGVGKTASAIGYALYKNLKTLAIVPKSVVAHWEREVKRMSDIEVCIWDNAGPIGNEEAQFHIIHYDIVKKFIDSLLEQSFDLLVCDESTYLKNHLTIRAKTILGYWKSKKEFPGIQTPYVLFLTGTPILNHTKEIFTILHHIDSDRFGNPAHFFQRYGGSASNPEPQNLLELHDRTKDLVIRRLFKQVAPEMPPKQRYDLVVDMTEEEQKAYEENLDKLFMQWSLEGRPSASQMPSIRNYLFKLKWPRIIEFVDEMLASDRPILVFTIHQDHAFKIKEHYGDNARVLTGKSSKKSRQETIDDLATGIAKVGVFTINAGGMGIDSLQHAINAVLFVDMWWVPATHEQAENRSWRTGQTSPVQCWYMQVRNTYDEYMRQILDEKQKMIDLAVDGVEVDMLRMKSIFKEVVRRMRYSMDRDIGNIDESDETE